MNSACLELEEEIASLEQESAMLLRESQTIIGGLSDLRYGRFDPSGRPGELHSNAAMEGLQRLQEACVRAGAQE
jgi:centromere-localized protein 2